MIRVDAAAREVAGAAGFDAGRLDAFLREAVAGLGGAMRLARIGGGQSNPTFFVDYDDRALVLRKQPPGELLPSAHAVDREYRVMRALGPTDVPVPRTVLFHVGRDVVGTPFYLMEKLEGRVFAAHALPGIAPAERGAMYRSMAETLATLHRVDPAVVGLADYGKPGNYFARQAARWSRQWQASRTRDNPWLDRMIAWLPAHLPPGEEVAICHGDYRIGNLMFDARAPRVIAILDWELSTLGHPLADLGFNAMAWHTRPDEYGGLRGLDLEALGIPSLDDHVAHYLRSAGRADGIAPFHVAFALFRFAVIFEGIAARAAAGNAAADDAAEAGKLGPAFARRAVELVGA
ncbi:Putative aminoglycoside phosphotransferase [Burkholderiales bacterium]|nr:Putative aminoglycoside phosphotransferase [Burkholderiales bacterium]